MTRAAIAVGLIALLATAPAVSAELQPYKVRYQASYRGISGGQIESTLTRDTAPNHWKFETRAYPNLLGRVAISPDARGRSSMQVTTDGVRPLQFNYDAGVESAAKDVRYDWDWDALRLRGRFEGKPIDFAVTEGAQDTDSVQLAMALALMNGRVPSGFSIVSSGRLRSYRYWSEGKATIDTALGSYETVIWVSQRDGSDRVSKTWHAPALGYVPVLAMQYRKGKAETVLKVVSLQREPPRP